MMNRSKKFHKNWTKLGSREKKALMMSGTLVAGEYLSGRAKGPEQKKHKEDEEAGGRHGIRGQGQGGQGRQR